MKNIIIFGGTSKIASEIALLHRKNNDNIFLVGRDFDKLVEIEFAAGINLKDAKPKTVKVGSNIGKS